MRITAEIGYVMNVALVLLESLNCLAGVKLWFVKELRNFQLVVL
jgi:hypothetical protein